MQTQLRIKVSVVLVCAAWLSACGGSSGDAASGSTPEPNLPATPFVYSVIYPTHFTIAPRGEAGRDIQPAVTDTDNEGTNNMATDAGATLGRVLFYDKSLSIDDSVSCASCHKQLLGFSDDAQVSAGVNGNFTRRHSMGLANARFFLRGRAFWDTRAASLEEQALIPIVDPNEMGLPDLIALEKKLAGISYYPALFEGVFGSPAITSDRVAKALAQFVRSLVSFNSPYDQGRVMQIDEQGLDPVESFTQPIPEKIFSAEENRGKQIFLTPITSGGGGCFSCHSTEAFINAGTGPTNNGLKLATPDDQGACEPPEFQSLPQRCGTFNRKLLHIRIYHPY
jgi:cytochrome c peroxidase